jgi:hypothetical protein
MPSRQQALNGECLERLSSLDLRNYVVLIGSGPSRPYVAPVEKLQELLGQKCGVTLEGSEEFWDLAERAHTKDRDAYHSVIEETYSKVTHGLSKAYQYLLSLPFQGFVTFNYDNQIPELCKLLRRTGPFSIYPPEPEDVNGAISGGQRTYAAPTDFTGSLRPVIAIHGCYSDQNPSWAQQVILKRSDYNEHYTSPYPYPLFDWWRDLLQLSPCLFIGTSLKEPGLMRVTQHLQVTDPARLASMGHLHLVGEHPNSAGEYPLPTKSLGVVEQLLFDPIDKDFVGLTNILKELDRTYNGILDVGFPGPVPVAAAEPFKFSSL